MLIWPYYSQELDKYRAPKIVHTVRRLSKEQKINQVAHSKIETFPGKKQPILKHSFRQMLCAKIKIDEIIIILSCIIVYFSGKLEPIGGAAPKFPDALRHDISTRSESQFSLLCPAQAHPLPAFRYTYSSKINIK